MYLLFFSLPLSKDEKINDDTTIRGNSHNIQGALALRQEK